MSRRGVWVGPGRVDRNCVRSISPEFRRRRRVRSTRNAVPRVEHPRDDVRDVRGARANGARQGPLGRRRSRELPECRSDGVLQNRCRCPARRVDRRGQEDWLQGNAQALTLEVAVSWGGIGGLRAGRYRPKIFHVDGVNETMIVEAANDQIQCILRTAAHAVLSWKFVREPCTGGNHV